MTENRMNSIIASIVEDEMVEALTAAFPDRTPEEHEAAAKRIAADVVEVTP